MSKIKKADLLQLVQEQADMMVELSGMVKMNKLSIIKLENGREQNSLIERDKVELTGSDLCKAMLLDIKKPVMCKTPKGFDLIKSFRTDGDKYLFHGEQQGEYSVVTPINNQGEPLTASEVGL